MHRRRELAALLAVLPLAVCAEGAVAQGQTRYAPYSPENYGDTRDHSGGGM